MAFRVEAFFLAREMTPRPDGRFDFTLQGSITRATKGPAPPAEMEPFTYVAGLVLHLTGEPPASTHTVGFEVEEPDGAVSPLHQPRPSEWPDWMRAGMPEIMAQAGVEGVQRDEAAVTPSMTLQAEPGAERNIILPIELRFRVPGEHRVHLLIDGQRERSSPIDVTYRPVVES